jgi:hypothetical protein
MQHYALEVLNKQFMEGKIFDILKEKLDESYNEYMTGKYLKKLEHWEWMKEATLSSRGTENPPKQRPESDSFLKKWGKYIERENITSKDEFFINLEGYNETVAMSLYILTEDGILKRLQIRGEETPSVVQYIVNRDISRIEIDGNIVELYSYKKWEIAETIHFELEEVAYEFYSKINKFRNKIFSQKHTNK